MTNTPILRVENLVKRFPGTVAVDHVNIEVRRNEVLALIGENGAGKSTFCKMLTGVYTRDEGDIYIDGKKVDLKNPADSIAAGIGMVYQERNLVGSLTAAQNISLGHEYTRGGLINEKQIMKKALEIRERLGIDVPLDIPVDELGAGEKQLVEIMRAFYEPPKVLILDEPTASLGKGEIEPFLDFICSLKKHVDISIIYITHKLEEISVIADRVTVLTDGHVALSAKMSDVTLDECICAMIRSDKIKTVRVPEKNHGNDEVVLDVASLEFDDKLHKLGLKAKRGEVVALYGLVGSGRTETMEAIFGIREAPHKSFRFGGETITGGDTYDMINKGMVLTPELRTNGIFPSLNLVENICSLFVKRFSTKLGFTKKHESERFSRAVLEKNGTKFSDVDQKIVELSGGNMQKIIIGRSVEVDDLKLLIADEPTAGMDLGAKSEIYLKLRYLADECNKSVIFISSELDELISVCDRMYVFFRGDIVAELKRADFSKETVLSYALKGEKQSDR